VAQQPDTLTIRRGGPSDTEAIAGLHADSWRRHYRGAYADAYLDGDIEAERLSVWAQRLSSREESTRTMIAEADGAFVGFVHVVFDEDPRWGSLVDNLHVVSARKRNGVGSQLMSTAGEAVIEHGGGLYLWVLEENTAAQAFYRARGGRCVDSRLVPPPGGQADRLNGSPVGFRVVWPDPAVLLI
jgi:ribosomal protein S18 acetylase RimI-like enzyme